MSTGNIIYKFIELYINDETNKIIKVIIWCKSLICIFFITLYTDKMLSKTFIDFSFIYPNTTIIKYGLKISFVFSRLFFSLCVFSFVMMVIFIFGCIYKKTSLHEQSKNNHNFAMV
mgnify:CR=1 FL=1